MNLRFHGIICAAAALLGLASCTSLRHETSAGPVTIRGQGDNPLFVPQGPNGYGLVFDTTYDLLDTYFDIAYSNRYDGRIETWPEVWAGYAQLWQFGFYDHQEALQSTFQTIRRRAMVRIVPAENGGYYVDLQILKELEDLPVPVHRSAGAASFRTENPIERQHEVIDPTVASQGWIPAGRDYPLEQKILERLKRML